MEVVKGLLVEYSEKNKAVVLTGDGRFHWVKLYTTYPLVGNEVYGIVTTVKRKIRSGLLVVGFLLTLSILGTCLYPSAPAGAINLLLVEDSGTVITIHLDREGTVLAVEEEGYPASGHFLLGRKIAEVLGEKQVKESFRPPVRVQKSPGSRSLWAFVPGKRAHGSLLKTH